jgi:hypothetical protein
MINMAVPLFDTCAYIGTQLEFFKHSVNWIIGHRTGLGLGFS